MTIASIYPGQVRSQLEIFHPERLRNHAIPEIRRAGDVNGDGVDDVLVALPPLGQRMAAGMSYVIFGSRSGLPKRIDLSQLNGNNGFAIAGFTPTNYGISSVSGAGDVNGDGVDDLILADVSVLDTARKAYVIYGQRSLGQRGFAPVVNVTQLDGRNGFAIGGTFPSRLTVSGAGDINGDGIGDIAIGMEAMPGRSLRNMQPGDWAGQGAVIFGRRDGLGASFDLGMLNGTNGFRGQGSQIMGQADSSLRSAGDLNGDGMDDLLVDTVGMQSRQGDRAYVIWGRPQGSGSAIQPENLGGEDGFVLHLGNQRGRAWNVTNVQGIGDINGDGFDDLMQFGFIHDGYDRNSSRYYRPIFDVIFGGANYGTRNTDRMMGSDRAETSYGFGGDDRLAGQGGDDLLSGGAGNDRLNGGTGNDTLSGEAGRDRLTGSAGQDRFLFGHSVRFRNADGTAVRSIDRITDFETGEQGEQGEQGDQIVLSRDRFNSLSRRSFAIETVETIEQAAQSAAPIVYQRSTGTLFYNQNGSEAGFGRGGAFITLENRPQLSAADFSIVEGRL